MHLDTFVGNGIYDFIYTVSRYEWTRNDTSTYAFHPADSCALRPCRCTWASSASSRMIRSLCRTRWDWHHDMRVLIHRWKHRTRHCKSLRAIRILALSRIQHLSTNRPDQEQQTCRCRDQRCCFLQYGHRLLYIYSTFARTENPTIATEWGRSFPTLILDSSRITQLHVPVLHDRISCTAMLLIKI